MYTFLADNLHHRFYFQNEVLTLTNMLHVSCFNSINVDTTMCRVRYGWSPCWYQSKLFYDLHVFETMGLFDLQPSIANNVHVAKSHEASLDSSMSYIEKVRASSQIMDSVWRLWMVFQYNYGAHRGYIFVSCCKPELKLLRSYTV